MAPEIITLAEALKRVNLADLSRPAYEHQLVGWTGQPKPFPCGHTATYGFGPVQEGQPVDDKQDRRGARREYQEVVRVNQYICGGAVLYHWQVYVKRNDDGMPYPLTNASVVVSIDKTPDAQSTCLAVRFGGR